MSTFLEDLYAIASHSTVQATAATLAVGGFVANAAFGFGQTAFGLGIQAIGAAITLGVVAARSCTAQGSTVAPQSTFVRDPYDFRPRDRFGCAITSYREPYDLRQRDQYGRAVTSYSNTPVNYVNDVYEASVPVAQRSFEPFSINRSPVSQRLQPSSYFPIEETRAYRPSFIPKTPRWEKETVNMAYGHGRYEGFNSWTDHGAERRSSRARTQTSFYGY